jgi:hypothetical protein
MQDVFFASITLYQTMNGNRVSRNYQAAVSSLKVLT